MNGSMPEAALANKRRGPSPGAFGPDLSHFVGRGAEGTAMAAFPQLFALAPRSGEREG
jgi:hypothetical protein